jgi:undecaprenyl-diphosphatase
MSDAVLAILLGIIEGLTEFLPVSSTAHLRICEAMFGMDLTDPFWKMFTIVIQLGAIASLFVYFGGKLVRFVRTFPKGEAGDRTVLTHPATLVCVAFAMTAVPALLLKKVIGENLESLNVMGWSLLVGGVVMWVVDHFYGRRERGTTRVEDVSMVQAIWIGACQVLSAVFPGTSRSMSTIAAGQLAGMTRPAALEFSFLLSIPTMVVATGYELYKVTLSSKAVVELGGQVDMDGHKWAVLAIGMVVSFVVALGVVAWFMGWVRKRGFVPFAIYRIVAGVAVLVWVARQG